jgi:putative intracellular protease/amidase
MQIAILLFDRFTALDAVGPYEVLSRLPGVETVFVAERAGWIAGDEAAQLIQLGIEYDPEPPYRAGGPRSAPPELVELMRGNVGAVMSGRA